jgi:hypothetical protein
MTTFVHIKHPDIAAIGGPVTQKAFDDLYEAKGWKVATAEEVQEYETGRTAKIEAAVGVTADDIDKMKRSDLDGVALIRGVDPTGFSNLDDLRTAVKATL